MSKLFNKWDLDEVKVEDLGLVKYICLDDNEQSYENSSQLW